MSNYYNAIDHYETPLSENVQSVFDDFAGDRVRQIQIRMVLIFGLALMVASALSLLALPTNVGTGSGSFSEASNPIGLAQQNTIDNQNNQAIVAAVQGPGIASFFTPEVQYWESEIVRWAAEHDVDPNAVATIMQIESCGNPDAVSIAGARGLFQVMPFHFSAGEEMNDPETNARRGLNFLNEQLRYTGGDMLLSFAGYNGGYAASGGEFNSWPDETKRYYQWAKGIYGDALVGAGSSPTLESWLEAGGRPGCERAANRLGI